MTAFLAFVVFNYKGKEGFINDRAQRANMNFWTGYVLLIACGTLLYITLMNMLPEVYGREEGECDDIIPDVPEEKNKSETDENKTYGRGV